MKLTIRKIIDILVYRPDISQKDREELIQIAGSEGLFLGMEKISEPKKENGDDERYGAYHATAKQLQSDGLGIKASTWDNKVFYFYTIEQNCVENAMLLMGYDSHGYWLDFFNDPPEPETPLDFKFEGGKK